MPTEPIPSPTEVQSALIHISNLEREMLRLYAGQVNMNPYIWIRQKLTPIARKLQISPTKALVQEALALKTEEPVFEREKLFVQSATVKDMMETSKVMPKDA